MTKIDLVTIESLTKTLNNGVKQCKSNGEPLDKANWLNQIGVILTGNQATEIATALEALPKLVTALQEVVEWKNFPETGKFWDKEGKEPMSYGAAWGSNGERDFMRNIAKQALTLFEATKTVQQ